MPGLRRSLGSADLPREEPGTMHIQKMRKGHYKDLGWPVKDQLYPQKRYFSEPKSYVQPIHRWREIDYDSDTSESNSSIHEGFENLRILPPSRSHAVSVKNLELSPTPPTLTNSDVTEATAESRTQQIDAQNGGGILGPSRSLRRSRGGNLPSPPTPQISPPSSQESLQNSTSQPFHLARPEQTQQPPSNLSPSRELMRFPSSHADSFRTAREDLLNGTNSSALASPASVHLSGDEEPRQKWSDSTEAALDAARSNLASLDVQDSPNSDTGEHEKPAPKAYPVESPTEFPRAVGDGFPDLDKHISYVSGPEELDLLDEPELARAEPVWTPEQTDNSQYSVPSTTINESSAARPGPVMTPEQTDPSRSSAPTAVVDKSLSYVQDPTDILYRQVREQDTNRHSGASSTSGAITVGIVVPGINTTPQKLKRRVKCGSLREESSPNSERQSDTPLKSTRAADRSFVPGDGSPSAAAGSSIRQVSSPPRLGPGASTMAALTQSSMQESLAPLPSAVLRSRKEALSRQASEQPRSVTAPALQRSPERTLRHVSPGDRLANNMSVRRTSLEVSRTQRAGNSGVQDTDALPSAPHAEAFGQNIAMKRDRIFDDQTNDSPTAPAVFRKPFIRGVIPSIASQASDGEGQRPQSSKSIRRFSREERLENVQARRASSDHEASLPRFGPENPKREDLLSDFSPRSFTSDGKSGIYSPRKSLDARQFHPNLTPISISQVSDHTDVSVREANGVRLYPHNGASIREVDVPQSSRPSSKEEQHVGLGLDYSGQKATQVAQPAFTALVEPPTPVRDPNMADAHAESPLTNPREAPQPPTFNFISPTPDIDRGRVQDMTEVFHLDDNETAPPPPPPQRSRSLLQRARRYSELLLVRTGSLRRPRRVVEYEYVERPSHLSPMWRPEGFWDDVYDSDDEYDFEPVGTRLPPGGDTSEVNIDNTTSGKQDTFPRKMSRRLPGFRGTGGFLLGNSVGIDRHGTNNRRHYVSTGTRTLSPRQSQDLVDDGSAHLRSRSQVSLAHTLPTAGKGASRVQWVPAQKLRAHVRALRARREERAREKRRKDLRDRIGMRVIHSEQLGGGGH